MIDALNTPVAVLESAGAVLAVNQAWTDGADVDELKCLANDSYLDWCAAFDNEIAGAGLASGVRRVLGGLVRSYEQLCRLPGSGVVARVRIQRIAHQAQPYFLVTHAPMAPLAAEEIEERVLNAHLEERERLAAELHDSVGQDLVCMDLGLSRLRRLSTSEGEAATVIAEIAESLQRAHAEIRTLSFLLQPPWMEDVESFETAVRNFVAGFARRAGLEATFRASGPLTRLCRARQLTLFRVLQESLVNIHRHARADTVDIRLVARGRQVTLKIRDNGRGMPIAEGAAPNAGVGLASMRSRLRKFGGDLTIVSGSEGTTLAAKLPC